MSLYEDAYGLTYLRVFVHYFMGLLLAFLLLAFGNITVFRINLVKSFIIVSLVFYTALNFINVDHLIVQHNLKVNAKTGEVDISYILHLSNDVIPALVDYTKAHDNPAARQLRPYLSNKKDHMKPGNWKSFNYSRYKARRALSDFE